jgi:uncharacterized protein YeaO (DUF488 family)
MMTVKIKRVYEEASKDDGFRILIDRLWPRGVSKEKAAIDLWLKEVSPSTELRKWFGHDPEKWEEFRTRYFKELDRAKDAVDQIRRQAKKGTVTLIYGTKAEPYSNAEALLEYLKK